MRRLVPGDDASTLSCPECGTDLEMVVVASEVEHGSTGAWAAAQDAAQLREALGNRE
jgi:hypothetical protein